MKFCVKPPLRSFLNLFYFEFALFVELNNATPVQHFNDKVSWIDFVPTNSSEIGSRAIFMMVVVIAFTHHQKVERKEVFRCIAHFEVSISVLMCKPVDDRTVDRAHEEVYWQQQVEPRRWSPDHVHGSIDGSPDQSRNP